MPNVFHFGHFAVVSSVAARPCWKIGVKRVGLLEVYPERVVVKADLWGWQESVIHIDPRCKCVKYVLRTSRKFYTHKNGDYWAHRRCLEKWVDMAQRWEKLWPCQCLSKDWIWHNMMEMG